MLIPLGEATSLRNLVKKLKENARLAYLCGFKFGKTPSLTIPPLAGQLIENNRMLKIFHSLVAQVFALLNVKKVEVAIDGTHLEAQKHDKEARWGVKRETFYFFGYKIVLITSLDPVFPIAIEVFPGNKSESPTLPILGKQLKEFHPELKIEKFFADAGFDSNENFKHIIEEHNAVPYIPINHRGKVNPLVSGEVYIDKDGIVRCKGGFPLVFNWYDKKRKRVKFRCPAALGKVNCLFYKECCKTTYGRTFYISKDASYRLKGIALWNSQAHRKEYSRKRYIIEQMHSILKNARGMKRSYLVNTEKIRFFAILCAFSEVCRKFTQEKEKLRNAA